jgi:hypothetical protein
MTTHQTNGMKYGVILPGGTAVEQLESALLAESSGWDGVFVWEAAYGVDAWSLLSAIAVRTERVRLGTLDALGIAGEYGRTGGRGKGPDRRRSADRAWPGHRCD